MSDYAKKSRLKNTMAEILRLCALIPNAKNLLITPSFPTAGYKLNSDGSYEATYYLSDGSYGQPRRKIRTGS